MLMHILTIGGTLKDSVQLDEALASYERAIVLKPDIADFILGDLLHTKMHLCIWDDLANHLNELTKKINNGEKVINPFALLALIDDPEVQRKLLKSMLTRSTQQSHVLSKIGVTRNTYKDSDRIFFCRLP